MTAQLVGKVALITGAGRGIGREHARVLAARGARIGVQDIDAEGAEATAAMIRDAGGEADVFVGDIADVAATGAMVAAAEQRLGGIDILVNNAGVHRRQTTEEITPTDFDWMFATHVKGTFFATQAAVRGMKARRAGKIVNTASIWGMTGNPIDSHYCAAKAAVLGLTRAWAKEFAPWGIRVNCLAPGMVMAELTRQMRSADEIRAFEQELIPLGRMGTPLDMANALAFLVSAESDFITGQVLSPNGGETIVGI